MRRSHRGLLLVLCAFLALALVPSPGRGELPSVVTNADASRTVTWTMNDSASLTAQNLAFAGGNASLPWSDSILSWPNGTAIDGNGAIDSHMVASPSGISLKQNWSNRLADGNFTTALPWAFVNGTAENTTAAWNAAQFAVLQHESTATETMWDNLDTVPGNWTFAGYCLGSTSQIFPVAGGNQKQGNAAMGEFVNVSAGSPCYAGAAHLTSVDWSAADRLTIWVYANQSGNAAFNLSALDGTVAYNTSPVDLNAGWQNVVVDLTQLGASRTTLTAVTLRIVGIGGQKVSNLRVFFDAIQVGRAKRADTTSHVYQVFTKSQSTTPLPGSARLSFDWSITNATGVAGYSAYVNLSSTSSYLNSSLASTPMNRWSRFQADVSSVVTTTGTYNLSFSLRVVLVNISASNVTLLIDNASFVFPGTQTGTYLSELQTMGADSLYTSLGWLASSPSSEGTVALAIRSGNTTTPGDPSWSSWQSWTTSPASPTVPGAMYFQLRAVLATSNASLTPVLESITLTTQHHLDHGSVLSGVFRADSTILSWRSFNASFAAPSGTTMTFNVGNGSYLFSVAPGSSLASLAGPLIQWQAVLTTSDGLLSPALHSVSVTYEYQGPPTRLVITHAGFAVGPNTTLNVTAGTYLELGAVVYDAGSHVVPSSLYAVGWSIDNASGGSVQSNGTYFAGKPGVWQVTAVLVGSTIYAAVRVNVTAATTQSSTPIGLWDVMPYVAVGIAALLGFAVYELLVRRMYAIDDVFLIAKDGRLIFHNTRRMRADRDEDILSSMLTAIMAFLRDQDPEENGELKSFEVGGKTTLLERGEHVYLTAIYSGRVPGWAGKDLHRFVTDLERDFGDAFAHWTGSPEDLHGLKEYMQRFVAHVRYHGGPRVGGPEN